MRERLARGVILYVVEGSRIGSSYGGWRESAAALDSRERDA